MGAGWSRDRDAAHGNLLHPLLVIGVQRIQTVNLVVFGLVGRRVARNQQRGDLIERVQRLGALPFLRFVEDQDRSVGLDYIDRSARLKIIQRFINLPVVRVARIERLDVDAHHVDIYFFTVMVRRVGL